MCGTNCSPNLALHAVGKPWLSRFQAASARYLREQSEFELLGVLVRDIDPDKKDLSSCLEKLERVCPATARIELIALYLPKGRIERLGRDAIDQRRTSRS